MSNVTNVTQRHCNVTTPKASTALWCPLYSDVSDASSGSKHFTRARTQVNVSVRGSNVTSVTKCTQLDRIIQQERVTLLRAAASLAGAPS